MQTILLVIHLIITLALVAIILLQRNASDGLGGLGGGGGSGGALLTGRSTANILTKTTAILATLFLLNCIAMAWLVARDSNAPSAIDRASEELQLEQGQPKETPKKAPAVPLVD